MTKRANNKRQKVKDRGFTLIELLISSAVFVTVSVIIVTILFVAFRVSKKTDTTLSLRQNGDNVLSQMVNGIRFAQSLDDPISCTTPVTQSDITITSSFDGGQTIYSCPNEDSDAIASNGATLIDTTHVVVDSCSFTCSQITPNDPPIITIQFTFSPNNSSALSENQAALPFQTSVTMRNYTR